MRKILFSIILIIVIFPLVAVASPIANVGRVAVNKGEKIIETRTGFLSDKDKGRDESLYRYRLQYDHGITDYYAFRVLLESDNPAERDFYTRNIAMHHRFHLIKREEYGWDAGFRLVYQYVPNAADQVNLRLATEVPFMENWRWRHNTILRREIGYGREKGVTLELRNQIAVNIHPYLEDKLPSSLNRLLIAYDQFNTLGRLHTLDEFGEFSNQLGPYIQADFNNGVFIATGYRVGTNHNSGDHLVKFIIGRNF